MKGFKGPLPSRYGSTKKSLITQGVPLKVLLGAHNEIGHVKAMVNKFPFTKI
jgi:hypothetical protein